VGAALKFNQTKREGCEFDFNRSSSCVAAHVWLNFADTDFINPDPNHAAWNVVRITSSEYPFPNHTIPT
jgi:hypothetical protein